MRNIVAAGLFVVVVISIILLCCFGCSDASTRIDNFCSGESRFKQIAQYGNDQLVYVDTQTGIEYFAIVRGYQAFGSALLDENGKPIKMEIK